VKETDLHRRAGAQPGAVGAGDDADGSGRHAADRRRLLIRSLQRLTHADLGLNPSHLLTADFGLSEARYKPNQMDQLSGP
jgi:hypothetical protein